MIAQLILTTLLGRHPALRLDRISAGAGDRASGHARRATGLYFVWVPAHATWLAALVGIGRGVDLILYVWVVISLIVLLNLHLKLRMQTETITVLARELAIANARSPAKPT